MNLQPRKTDSAWELASFILWTRGLQASNPNIPLFQVIANAVQLDPSHQMFYTMIGALVERTVRVGRIRSELHQNAAITEAENIAITSALSSISLFVLPPNLNSAWGNLSSRLKDENVVALMSMSQLIRESHPLRSIRDSDIAEICVSIDAKYKEIFADTEIDPWIREVICDALLKLTWYVRFVRFFGHEIVFDGLLMVQEKAARLAEKTTNRKAKSSLYEVVNFIAVLATAYAAPDATYTATRHYLELFNHEEQTRPLLPSHKPKEEGQLSLANVSLPLLPGPKAET